MITQFHVENFKALKDVTIDLTPIHVLIGPNDSGKTSILQAMAALSLSSHRNINECFIGRHKRSPLLWNGITEGQLRLAAKIRKSNSLTEYNYSISLTIDGDDHIFVSAETLNAHELLAGANVFTKVNATNKNTNQSEIIEVHNNIYGLVYCHWDARFLSLPVSLDQSRQLKLEINGFGLAQYLDDILSIDRKRFTRIEDRFKAYFPNVSSIQLRLESAYRITELTDLTQIYGRFDGKGIWFLMKNHIKPIAAAQVSEGMLIVLAYLAVLYSPSPPRFLFIEEPENGIHPHRLKEVLGILRELINEQSHTQILMTTHSPDVVAEFLPEEVTLCSKDIEGAVITRRLSEIPEVVREGNFFNLGEIWLINGDEKLMHSKSEPLPTSA